MSEEAAAAELAKFGEAGADDEIPASVDKWHFVA